jgi:hypothetical protein
MGGDILYDFDLRAGRKQAGSRDDPHPGLSRIL